MLKIEWILSEVCFGRMLDRVDFVRGLLRTNVGFLKGIVGEPMCTMLDDLVDLFDLAVCLKSTGRHADEGSSDNSPEDAETIAGLEEEVKDKEEEIKRLGDGWSDSEEMLTGLINRMS